MIYQGESGVPQWRTSSYSGANGNCVEVAVPAPTRVAVRDSKDPEGPSLDFSAQAWAAFTSAAAQNGFATA
jgi:hypothetical protein